MTFLMAQPISKLVLIVILATALDANAMIRVFKYRKMDQIKDDQICIVTGHEHNTKKQNQGRPTNNKKPMLCKLAIHVGVRNKESKTIKMVRLWKIQEYHFNATPKTCFRVPDFNSAEEKILGLDDLQLKCATLKSYKRFFADHQLHDPTLVKIYEELQGARSWREKLEDMYTDIRIYLGGIFKTVSKETT